MYFLKHKLYKPFKPENLLFISTLALFESEFLGNFKYTQPNELFIFLEKKINNRYLRKLIH